MIKQNCFTRKLQQMILLQISFRRDTCFTNYNRIQRQPAFHLVNPQQHPDCSYIQMIWCQN
ncbi:unnamed protein product [Paramecium sonneborni]|uniref:Uncharacterized protein n=1 Tax=Paramecium sonneborni TaxID=65129 RepID=A0A8S1Q2J4_9CILI|nr:unnamed protein product [Paramecium sonneborni]